ncbi:MAG: apolipoprotein N-acyltransferase [Planctomycetes bacterium]|nr:apolipoprotein N-acyltransferase [Planctomycetota bacterium]
MTAAPRTVTPTIPDDGRRVWLLAVAGAATMFLVQPPADLWWLAWLAPLPWLNLVTTPRLAGPHPWLAIWTGGFLHWLFAIHWLRLPHPATSIGWVALAVYLACYVPLFVWAARRLVHHRGWPLVPSAALAWMACEQLRGQLLGGFTFGMLGHTQWRWTALIQCADAFGAVGVSGLVMAVAAACTTVLDYGRRRHLAAAGAATAAVILALAYGSLRLATTPAATDRPLDVLLVQGCIDTELKHDPDKAIDVAQHYDSLTLEGLAATGTAARPDLIVWPETMWRWPVLTIDPAERLPEAVVEEMLGPAAEGDSSTDRQARCREALERQRFEALETFAMRYGTTWLVGVDRQVVTPRATGGAEHFNSGLFLDAEGRPVACYDKMHPVMFGEYVPLAETFPVLYRITPLPAGLSAGAAPVAVQIAGYEVAPTICYETALPEAIRGLVRSLAAQGRRPDVIVNLTNDGWFWGSSELDMHLAAAIFRAIEVRTPVVVAANTGFSAAIDGSGRLLDRGPRRRTATLRAAVQRDGRSSPWLGWGSLPAWACVTVVAVLTVTAAGPKQPRSRRNG